MTEQTAPISPESDALLLRRLAAAGLDGVRTLRPVRSGTMAVACLAELADGTRAFVKTLAEPPGDDLFEAEAEGLAALRDLGGAATPEALLATSDLLVLRALHPRPDTPGFWERLGHAVAALHTATVHDRFGWHRDNWLGRKRQYNPWHTDGHEFYARYRILRWLDEPLVADALDREDRRAVERLCARLPEVVPAAPACLTHGDLWTANVVSGSGGEPVLVDPAVSYNWPETDLSMLWNTHRPPESDRFFDAYTEAARPEPGWQERLPVLHLRQLLCLIAHGYPDRTLVEQVRRVVAPFRRRG